MIRSQSHSQRRCHTVHADTTGTARPSHLFVLIGLSCSTPERKTHLNVGPQHHNTNSRIHQRRGVRFLLPSTEDLTGETDRFV